MVAIDPVEQLHPARLQPKHADSVADLGTFVIEIVGDLLVGDRAQLQPGCFAA